MSLRNLSTETLMGISYANGILTGLAIAMLVFSVTQ